MMIDKLKITLVLLTISSIVFSQNNKSCSSEKTEVFEDLNTITKCSFKVVKNDNSEKVDRKSTKVVFEISSRKRIVRKKAKKNSINGINAKIKDLKTKTSLIGDLNIAENKTASKIPYNLVDVKPTLVKCVNNTDNKKCLNKEIFNHVKSNFKYPEASYKKGIQGRVLVQFVIDEYGFVNDIVTRGPYKGEELEKEAKRIIEKLPKFKPGKIGNNIVKVKYGVPISFKIPGVAPTNVRKKVIVDNVKQFNDLKEIPLFNKCKKENGREAKLNCFNLSLSGHIKRNFTYPEDAISSKIEGKVHVEFIIDKTGNVVNIETKTPANASILGRATEKMVEKLPNFIPGKLNGKNVNVKYSFPINYKLD